MIVGKENPASVKDDINDEKICTNNGVEKKRSI